MRIFRHYFCGYGHQWVVPDSIISKFNSTVLFRILFRQYRSKCEKLRLDRTSPLIHAIADIQADVDLRRFGPLSELGAGNMGSSSLLE